MKETDAADVPTTLQSQAPFPGVFLELNSSAEVGTLQVWYHFWEHRHVFGFYETNKKNKNRD